MPDVSRPSPSADEITEMAARGEDISQYFTNPFEVVRMARELDERAGKLNISRQAVIKTMNPR